MEKCKECGSGYFDTPSGKKISREEILIREIRYLNGRLLEKNSNG